VRSSEPIFGFAVFGETDDQHLFTNRHAEPGDLLFLTKPLGAGSLTTSVSRGEFDQAQVSAVERGMAHLNRDAAAAGHAAGVKAATDITGFGLLGHAGNIARGSSVQLKLEAGALPLYDGAAELAEAGVLSGGSARNRNSLGDLVEIAGSVPPWLGDLCFDAETSGGLLLAVKPERQGDFLAALPERHHVDLVGEVLFGSAKVSLC
jgi:selenide,water dikinase